MAAAGKRPVRQPGPVVLDEPGPDRRARHLRLDLPGRRPGAVGQRQVPAGRGARADGPAHRAGRGDQPDRPHRHRVDQLQPPVQPGPPVRLAGPRQRRAGRLEHRHHGHQGGRAELRARRQPGPRRALPAGGGVHRGVDPAVGQLGGRRGARRQGGGRLRRRQPYPRSRLPGRVLQGPRARSTSPGHRRAARCWSRRARRTTAGSSPPGTPRRCSPPSRRSATRRSSTPT